MTLLIVLVLRRFSGRLRRLNLENQAMLGEMTRVVQEAHEVSRVTKIYDGFDYEQGRIVEIGRHAELLARGGLYSHLHRIQFSTPPREAAE